MNPICFYHKADLDGVCSAAIIKRFVPECDLYGIDYGEEFPWDKVEGAQRLMIGGVEQNPSILEKRTVYMVDFSLQPYDQMTRLARACNLWWFDHHSEVIKWYETQLHETMIAGIRTTKAAACEICWGFFGKIAQPNDRQQEIPTAVRLLGAYDSWRKEDPKWASEILPFQYGARAEEGAYDPTHDLWQKRLLVTDYVDSVHEYDEAAPWLFFVIERGSAILRFQHQLYEQIAKDCAFVVEKHPDGWRLAGASGRMTVPELRCLCLNTPLRSSAAFDSVWDPQKHDLMLAFYLMKDGRWRVSLYSVKPEIDCGALAKTLGGGGHRGAAGFQCAALPWM